MATSEQLSLPPRRDIAPALLALTSRLAAAGDPSEVLDVLLEHCPSLLGADLVNVSLLDPDGDTLRLVSSRSTSLEVAEEFAAYPLDAPLPTRDAMAGEGRTVVLRSLAERDARYPALAGVEVAHEAFLVTPLRTARVRVGALGLGWLSSADLTDEVVAVSESVAELVASALERALAARDEMRARRRAQGALLKLQSLQQLTSDLAHTTDVREAGDLVAQSACDELGADAATIHMLDASGTWATQLATCGLDSEEVTRRTTWPVTDSDVALELLETGEPVVVRSRRERDERFPSFQARRITQQAWVTVLLTVGGRAVGIAAFGWDEPHDVDDDELVLLQALAGHAAAAIDRARLIEDEQAQRHRAERGRERLVLLSEVGRVLDSAADADRAVAMVRRAVLAGRADWCRFEGACDDAPVEPGSPLHSEEANAAAQTAAHERAVVAFTVLEDGRPSREGLAVPVRWSGPRPLVMLVAVEPGHELAESDRGAYEEVCRRLAARLDNLALLEEQTRIAERLQESLLPAPFPEVPWLTLGSAYEPADTSLDVCGDFLDVFEADDGDLVLVIGDVVGRGVEAAGLTGLARHTLRALAGDLSPDRALRRLNGTLLGTASRDEAPSLLTAACLRLRRTEGGARLTLALGGHCQPVLVQDGRVSLFGEPGTLLGAFDTVSHPLTTVDLAPGDVVVLYTDGVIEAKGAEVADQFGDERLIELLVEQTDHDPAHLAREVIGTVRRFRRSAPDDMAVLVVRID
ncbi:MAG: SpoIIE family protein phosphatase [Frankiales bacterium]|nr:SpoIIE family protein phosphatase [Frankiales bacterium]